MSHFQFSIFSPAMQLVDSSSDSTHVESILQIEPYLKKQSQFAGGVNVRNIRYNKGL